MTEQEAFILAQALKAVVDQIRDDQRDLMAPDDMTRRPGTTLRETLNYHPHDARVSFRGRRAYDFAKFNGADATMPADLVQGLREEIFPSAEGWRKLGAYGPAVGVPEDAPKQDRLLVTGRQPS